ncbi:hypothetical protein ABK040_005035 [Willaertia magna]
MNNSNSSNNNVSKLGTFDFIYSSGLFDYLNKSTAERLTEIMFSLTKSGGKMYVTNMTDTVPASGYMETYMGWNLIYRTPSEIEALGQGLNRGEIESKRIFVDRTGCVGFLEIDKAEKEGNFNFFLSSL